MPDKLSLRKATNSSLESSLIGGTKKSDNRNLSNAS